MLKHSQFKYHVGRSELCLIWKVRIEVLFDLDCFRPQVVVVVYQIEGLLLVQLIETYKPRRGQVDGRFARVTCESGYRWTIHSSCLLEVRGLGWIGRPELLQRDLSLEVVIADVSGRGSLAASASDYERIKWVKR